VAVCAACSGSSDQTDTGLPPFTSRPAPPTTARRAPITTPATIPVTTPRTVRRPQAPESRKVYWVPKSINATGRVNVTERLQQFIDRVPNGHVIRFRHNGRYRSEGTLFVSHRENLVFDGNGATVFATIGGVPDRAQFWVKDGSTIVFRDLNVRGANPKGGTAEGAYNVEQETQHGFRLEGVDGVEIDSVHVSDVYGDFVYIGRDKKRVASQNVWIHDSDFRRNGRQGIAVTAATNVIIERNTFFKTRRSTIDLEPNSRSWHVSNVFVLNNTVGKGRLLFVASHGQGPVDNIVISGNQLHGHALTIDVLPPDNKRRSNWIVTNNTSDMTVHNRPMRFFAIDGLVVSGNTQLVSGEQPGVIVTNDCGAQITRNDFGAAGVVRHGDPCAAEITVPQVPAMLDRNAAPPTTSTTSPPPVTAPPPHPPVTKPRPVPTTAPAGSGSDGGNGFSSGLAIAAVFALALIAIGLFVRSRGRGSTAD
jgi:Right handed beta helix region